MSEFLTREQLIQKRPMRTEEVEVPELGGKVLVKALTTGERGKYENSFLSKKGTVVLDLAAKMRSKLVSQTVVDASGKLLLTEDDIPLLEQQDAGAIVRIYEAAQRLSGFTKADMDEIEDTAKNLAATESE